MRRNDLQKIIAFAKKFKLEKSEFVCVLNIYREHNIKTNK